MNNTLKRISVITILVFVAWILILFFATDALFQNFYGQVGFCGGILAFVLSAASLVLWKPNPGRDTTEIDATPLIFTGVYFVVALLANTLFCFTGSLNALKPIPIAVNALLIIVFVAVRIFVLPYRDRVSHTAARTAEKTRGAVRASAKLGELMGMTQDAAVKQQLSALMEQLSFSNNVSQSFSADLETLFFDQLCDIGSALERQAPTEDVLKMINAAQNTWRKRNGSAFTN